MTKLFAFSSDCRLLKAEEFQAVFSGALYKPKSEYFRMLARHTSLDAKARLGITVAKRRVASSVKRNQIRRLIRETFRLTQHQLKGLDIVLIYTGPAVWNKTLLHRSLERQWQTLISLAAKD